MPNQAPTRFTLRPWRKGDEEALVLHGNNRKVWRNLTELFPHPYTLQDAENWISVANESPPSTHLAIELEGAAIGGTGFIAGEGTSYRTALFGYWLGEAHWGKGIATRAAREMAKQVFSNPRFARLEASVFEWNTPSMRVLEKAGFVREGVLKKSVFKDGQLVDSVVYGLLRDA